MTDRNLFQASRFTRLCVLVFLLTGRAEAGKIPLQPEELQQKSDLIVVGNVVSHFETEKDNRDGSQITYVYLRVEVSDVEKGTVTSAGDQIEVACWVITKAPRKGNLWDSGHAAIPAEESRVRLFLQKHGEHYFDVIYPNGIERLDDGATLTYPMKPADPVPSVGLAIAVGGGAFLLATGVFVWLFVSRRPSASGPGS